jgi:hypothetical protein
MSETKLQHTQVKAASAKAPATAGGVLQRKCDCGNHTMSGKCDDCAKKKSSLQRKATNESASSEVPTVVHEVLRSPGQPLDAATRAVMEPRFGHDFSRVRVHTDATASESTKKVSALAYTVGEHISFQEGQYNPGSNEGRRLLAHELTHVLQQRPVLHRARAADDGQVVRMNPEDRHLTSFPGAIAGWRELEIPRAAPRVQAKLEISTPGDRFEQEADRIAEAVTGHASIENPIAIASGRAASAVQRQPAPGPGAGAPACPTVVTFSASDPVHVPSCGAFRATTNVAGITWSLAPNPTAVDPGTTIAANGTITIANSQAAGQINAVATARSGCFFSMPFRIRSQPTGIANTVMAASPANPANNYGAVFDHTFISADGNVASLDQVGVGERFVGVPNPTGATHAITTPTNPFGGTFTLSTATLTPGATNNWFLTPAGTLGGTQDNVTMGRANINVGRFVQSFSNPSPPQGLPATMTLTQGLHWFCPQAPAATRWRMPAFVNVAHSRTLRNRGGVAEVVTTVNGLEVVDAYSGPFALFNLTASPVSMPRRRAAPPAPGPGPAPPAPGPGPAPGPAAPAPPAPGTVRITVDTLPATIPGGQTITFSLIGNALGCSIAPDPTNNHAAILTIGPTAGTVTVEAADPTRANLARVTVVIT